MIRFILLDIEGTTTSISFVHEVLFPYASKHLAGYVHRHASEKAVQEALASVKKTVSEEQGVHLSDAGAVEQLLAWIREDRKHTALKTLQGLLWKEGYESGQYQGHIYEDVVPVLEKWKQAGIRMGIYSSGSVEAQKLLFGFSEKGDLTPYFSAYFDTLTGHKREAGSYARIREALGMPAEEILFLSDVEAELDAAAAVGFHAIQLVRPGTPPSSRHLTAANFEEVDAKKQRF